MAVTPHDFTRPLPLAPDLRTELTQWLGRANGIAVEQFVPMAVPIQLRTESCAKVFPSESVAKWSDKAVAFKVVAEGCDAVSLIALPNSLILEFISRMLGENPEARADERSLTDVEKSIAQFIVETLVASLNESCLTKTPCLLKLDEAEPNLRRTRYFRPTESLIDCRTHVKTPLGESHWNWFLSLDFLAQVFGLSTRIHASADATPSRTKLEALVRGMHADIVVRLGNVQLTGPQLAALRVGDLVVLDQRVSEPLNAMIRGEPKFVGWAGRVGNRQAFEIESEVNSTRFSSPRMETVTS